MSQSNDKEPACERSLLRSHGKTFTWRITPTGQYANAGRLTYDEHVTAQGTRIVVRELTMHPAMARTGLAGVLLNHMNQLHRSVDTVGVHPDASIAQAKTILRNANALGMTTERL